MPVNNRESISDATLRQRTQYGKGGIGKWYWDYRDATIIRMIQPEAIDILDAGCGEGITLERLCRRFPDKRVRGIDVMTENIEICSRLDLPVKYGDVTDLDVESNSVDCCILSEVIEHLFDPGSAINEMYRVLRPHGRLIIVFPNDRVFKLARILTGKFTEASYDPGHVCQWTPGTMRTQLERSGFLVCGIRAIPFFLWPLSLHCVIAVEKRRGAEAL